MITSILVGLLPTLAVLASTLFGKSVDGLVSVEQSKITAESDQAKLDEDLAARQVAAGTTIATTNAEVVTAEQAHWFTRAIRPMVAAPFILWIWLAIADKTVLPVFGIHHSTDDLGNGTLHWICLLVCTSYFGPMAWAAIRKN